jgi:RNA polymerase sigma-70 factor (ECF subfamily)
MHALVSQQDPDLAAALDGDPDAWAALLRAHGPLVYGLCRRLDADPDDAYQAIWERVLRGLSRFDPSGPRPFRSWLVTVAHRHLVDRHRRRAVRTVVVSLSSPPDVAADGAEADEALDAHRRHSALERALAELSEPARRVVVLHHLHGEELLDIAHIEGVALGTVKSRLHRARARLLELLPPDLFGDPS